MAIPDASTLIALAKMQRLAMLRDVYKKLTIGPVVKREVIDAGRAISAPGVEQVEEALEEGWLLVTSLNSRERKTMGRILRNTRLDEGEAECIALAQPRREVLIVDDKEARALAAAMNLEYLGTAAVFLRAFLEHRLKMRDLEDAIDELSRTIWLSPAVVADILKKAREAEK